MVLERQFLPISKDELFLIGKLIQKIGDVLKKLIILDVPENPGDNFCITMRRSGISYRPPLSTVPPFRYLGRVLTVVDEKWA